MGSWNATCGLSQTPILEGDLVKVFLLSPSVHYESTLTGNGFCYPEGLFRPLFLPIEGVYNSYGSITEVIDLENVYFKFLKNNELFKEKSFTDFEELLQQISYGNHKNISMMFVHKDLYDKTILSVSNQTIGYLSNEPTIETHYEKIAAQLLSIKPSHMFLFENEIYIKKLPSLLRQFQYFLNETNFTSRSIVECMLFEEVLSTSRKFWSPQSGAGSQDVDFSIQNLINEFSSLKESQYLEEYGD